MPVSRLSLIISLSMLALPSAAHAGGNVKGKFKFDLELGIGGGKELLIREPSMCEGGASAKIKWNKNKDQIKVRVKVDGLPQKPTYCFEESIDTPYNMYPMCVEEGFWQTWFVSRFFTRPTIYYYDAVTGDLIDNEFDLPAGPPPGSIPVELTAAQMVCSDFWRPNANLKGNVKFTFDYDQILDAIGSPGTLVGVVPFNLFDDESFWLHYTEEILPMEEAQTWDTTLAEIEAGIGATVISISAEPVPKPPYLLTHDQLMISWTESFPTQFLTPLPPEAFDDPDCGTEQIHVPFPGGELPI